ncbi:MAG: hypothetical protein ABEJ56_00180 [Candidatus Nanohaloarchaea archaeon]
MDAEDFASRIIDLAAEYDFIEDYSIDIREEVVLDSRIDLEQGSAVEVHSKTVRGILIQS